MAILTAKSQQFFELCVSCAIQCKPAVSDRLLWTWLVAISTTDVFRIQQRLTLVVMSTNCQNVEWTTVSQLSVGDCAVLSRVTVSWIFVVAVHAIVVVVIIFVVVLHVVVVIEVKVHCTLLRPLRFRCYAVFLQTRRHGDTVSRCFTARHYRLFPASQLQLQRFLQQLLQ